VASPLAQHPHGDVDPEKEYKLRSIIAERPGQYLIDWEDDEETGEPYEPSWEPKANANRQAVADWKRRKAERRAAKGQQQQSASPAKKGQGRPAVEKQQPQQTGNRVKRGRGRPRKISPVEQWPPASWDQNQGQTQPQPQLETAPPEPQRAASPHREEPEIVESPDPEAVLGAEEGVDAAESPLFEPAVESSDPPSSFQNGAYQNFSSSEQAETKDVTTDQPAALQLNNTEGSKQPKSVPVKFGEGPSKVIPDSQTLGEFSSSAPAAAGGAETDLEVIAAQSPEVPTTSSGVQPNNLSSVDPHTQPASVTEIFSGTSSSLPPSALSGSAAPVITGGSTSEKQAETVTSVTVIPKEQAVTASGAADGQSQDPSAERDRSPEQQQLTPGAPEEADPHTESVETSNHETPQPQLQTSNGTTPAVTLILSLSLSKEDTPRQSREAASPEKSTLPSSFPFKTQFARPASNASQTSPAFQTQILPLSSFGRRAPSQPLERAQVSQYSSPIPPVPSRSLDTIGESAPQRLRTPSPFSNPSQLPSQLGQVMEASPGSVKSTLSLTERLKAIREKRRAELQTPSSTPSAAVASKPQVAETTTVGPLTRPPRLVSSLIAEEQDRRSPSAVPAMEQLPEITQEEMNNSERYPTLLPQFLQNGIGNEGPVENGVLSRELSKGQVAQAPTSRTVPIGLTGHQRDQCSSMVGYHKDLIERFLASNVPDDALIAEAERFVERLRNVALHPDLDNPETFTQYDVTPKQQAEWDVSCSAKFRFLKSLFDASRDQTLHVAIVTRSGRIMEILRTFLKGISVRYRHVTEVASFSLRSEDEGLMVTLLSTEDEVADEQPSPADLLIALEPTVLDSSSIRILVQEGAATSTIQLTLVVPLSVEHAEQSISSTLAPRTRLRALINGISQYRNDVGKLDDEQLPVDMAAAMIADYLATEDRSDWPTAALQPLLDLDSQTESDLEHAVASDIGSSATNKRSFDVDEAQDEETDTHKRVRVEHPAAAVDMAELPTTINPQEIEITHISDSLGKPTQPSTLGTPLTENELRLQRMLQEAQERLDEHVRALSDLQYRHEEQRQNLFKAEQDRDQAIMTAQSSVKRMTENADNVSQLKKERTELQQQLEEAKARLLDHNVPEKREFEALRLAVEKAQAEKKQVEDRLKSAEDQLEYLRNTYQESSRGAQALVSQVSELENEAATLRNQATGEQAKLREMGYNSHTKMLQKENKQLKARLKNYEATLKFKEEELLRANRGRITTRGSSVPRSPRLGSPMKMGRGSRQASPAAGELKGKGVGSLHPLRNG
jgi:hypothetical protein